MNSFLWVQWKEPTDPNRFVIDGKISIYAATIEERECVEYINMVSTFKQYFYNKTISNSPSFRYSHSSNLYCIEGNFAEKDNIGRNLAYVFVTANPDREIQLQTLIEYSKKLGLNLFQTDLDTITKAKKKTIYTNILWTILIICIGLFTLLIALSKQ